MKINNLDDYANPKMPKIPDLISGGGYDTSGYDSPITLIASQMETKIENDVMSTIQRYGIDINKEELIKALQYDRQQYDKGFQDACNNRNLWNDHQIACMLADIFNDTCACNYNGNDEWLPKVCDFAETCCPDPFGVACWEQFVKNYKNKLKSN